MRTSIGYALCVFLLSTCSPCPVVAQSSPANQPLQPSLQKLPLDAKQSQVPRGAEIGGSGLVANFSDTLAGESQPPVTWFQSAHILIWQPTPNLDPKMIREVPKDFSSNMPIFQGLPPSSQDFRGVFLPPQLLPPISHLRNLSPSPKFSNGIAFNDARGDSRAILYLDTNGVPHPVLRDDKDHALVILPETPKPSNAKP